MIFRWDPCGIICIGLTYAALVYADYVFVEWLILPSLQGSLWAVFHVICFNVIIFMLLLAHVRAMISDPGIVPLPTTPIDLESVRPGGRPRTSVAARGRNLRSDTETDSQSEDDGHRVGNSGDGPPGSSGGFVGEDWTVCGRCEAYRPPRAHHCRVCRRCVRKMDHHCPWINNCVGEFNQKYFVQFLLYVAAASLYALGMICGTWLITCNPKCKDTSQDERQRRIMHSIALTIECVIFSLFVIAVSCDQFQAILSDSTMIEQIQRRGGGYSQSAASKMELLRSVCGRGPIALWILPCHSVKFTRDYVRVPAYFSSRGNGQHEV